MRRGIELAAAVALVAFSASAHAQDHPGADAETLFLQGSAALEEGRFPEAARLFGEVLALRPHLGAAFNLAVALRGQGRMTRALDVLGALLSGRYGALADHQRREVLAIREDVVASVVRASIVVSGARLVRILLDGDEVGSLAPGRPFRIRVDPGEHVVTASAADGRTVSEQWDARTGSVRSIRLDLAVDLPTTRPARADGGSAWPWVLGIGIPVVVGIGTLVAVLLVLPEAQRDFLGHPVTVP